MAKDRRQDFEDAAAQAKLGFWEYDPETLRVRGSAIANDILGLADEAATLAAVSDLYVAESGDKLVRGIELALTEGKPFSLIAEISTPAGQRRWIRTQGQVRDRTDAAPARVFGTIQDISDIRLLDRITQESEMTLNQVEQITHIGHWSVSLVDGSIYHSDEIKRIFGYEPAEYALSVEEAIEAYHPDDRDEVIRLFNRAVETGEGYEFDLRIVQPSGDIRYVHSKGYTERNGDGKVTRVYGVFQDVTEWKGVQRALRESEASMKALIDGVRTAIVVHGKDGEILLSNQMANRLLAPLAVDVVGKELTDPAWRFESEDGTRLAVEQLPVSRILRTREPVENLVLGRRDAERVAWLLVNGIPVFDKTGELSRIIISFVDITDHKQMEERLRQSEKMKAIGQLAGGVAHDFNNQLTVIMNFAALLERKLEESSPQRSYVSEIMSAGARSADLTKQLLAFARGGKYVVTQVDANELIASIVSMAGRSFDKKIRITHHASAQPAVVAGDHSQLQNALLNLALNSRDAMPEGGELVFETECVALDPHALKSSALDARPGECLRITVRDNGIGMDAAVRERIFEPFFTTKEPGTGTGMGMASVYGTIENHHGAIEVESEPGKGTTVTVYLPLDRGGNPTPARPTVKTRELGGRILIIDDEPAVLKSMCTLLESEGFETITCDSGRAGLSEFEKSWQSTDLVLLDMIMPELNGIETFHAMKQIDPNVKALLLSGYSFSDEAKQIVADGAAGLLLKPVDADDLLRTIADVLATDG